jgi:molybdopterin/thiamine biosynthesis adenylyltransferase
MLTDSQRRRYARNISLEQIGEAGQERLLASNVLVIGAGGLGSASLSYLSAAGIGHIGIADYDRVELSNLQRQILYETADIGRMKAESARDRIEELNSDIKISLYLEKIEAGNIHSIIKDYDLIIDGCDNFKTRFLINDACYKAGKTLISAAIRGFSGQLAVFKSYLSLQPCYRCFVHSHPDDERGCQDIGVLGAMAGILGSLQALETIKELLGTNDSMAGKLLVLDGITLKTHIIKIMQDATCPCCSNP